MGGSALARDCSCPRAPDSLLSLLRNVFLHSMSGTGPRENVFPTRMALTNTKLRLKGAQTGHSLLAKKRDALTTRFRAILRRVDEVRHVVRAFAAWTWFTECVSWSCNTYTHVRDDFRRRGRWGGLCNSLRSRWLR